MPTKPEGPAQEPIHVFSEKLIAGIWGMANFSGKRVLTDWIRTCADEYAPATPAPSQPAGWLSAIREVLTSDKSDAAKLIAVGILASSSEPLTEAEIKRGQQIWNEHGAPSQPAGAREFFNEICLHVSIDHRDKPTLMEVCKRLAQQTAAKDVALVAAERERDILRVENAALKAGKE